MDDMKTQALEVRLLAAVILKLLIKVQFPNCDTTAAALRLAGRMSGRGGKELLEAIPPGQFNARIEQEAEFILRDMQH